MKDFSKDNWGIVFNGGGGKGAYQIGVLRALYEKHIDDYITMASGSSVGALNLVLFAYNDIQMAQDIWKDISPKQFLEIDPDLIDFKEGFVSREGLIEIFTSYIDFDIIRNNERTLYAVVTEFNSEGNGEGIPRYMSLNYKSEAEIKQILLASSALPVVYEPVKINDHVYRDGGLSDNSPIMPLYIEGIRHFIVIGLSNESVIDTERFPDAEFVLIKPEQSIGDFFDGTLDFSSKGAKLRMELGYLDGIRALEFSSEDLSIQEVNDRFTMSARQDYSRVKMQNMVNDDIDNINNLINKYK